MKKIKEKSAFAIVTIALISIGILMLDALLCVAAFRNIDECTSEQIACKVVLLIIGVTVATAFFGGLLVCIYNDKEH